MLAVRNYIAMGGGGGFRDDYAEGVGGDGELLGRIGDEFTVNVYGKLGLGSELDSSGAEVIYALQFHEVAAS